MSKHRTKTRKSHEEDFKTIAVELPLPLLAALTNARESVMDLCIHTGLGVLRHMMEEDRAALCGTAGRHDADREAYRGGTTPGEITFGGRRVGFRRPRVCSVRQGEVALPAYTWAPEQDPLDQATWEAMVHGVATRRYESIQPPLPAPVRGRASSRSAVSRRFVALGQRKLTECLTRPLGELDLWLVMIDGIVFADHVVLVTLGIGRDGTKHVLGVREGATENAAVARALLRDLLERGLPGDHPLLFVIDGGLGLRKAIREAFAERGVVRRCHVHKIRNVLGHLPEAMHRRIRKAMEDAYRMSKPKLATRRLKQLASSLEADYPSAAASLREGLEETLTLQRLGIRGALWKTLRSTNPIENLNSGIARFTRNVKRWRDGSMILRWVGSAVIEAERHFRRVRGYKQMPRLIDALTPSSNEGATEEEAA
jgi:transposase-like protein